MTRDKTINLGDYISPDDAGKIAGLTGRRIRQLLSDNEIEGVKVGRTWLVNRDSLYKYLGERGK